MNPSWLSSRLRHIGLLVFLSLLMVSFGTLGYVFLGGFRPIEALYMTIITFSTVGFGEVAPLNDEGRLFTILLILMGAGFVAYNLSYFTQMLLDENLTGLYRRRKVRKQLEQLRDHYIICGYGQMGQIIVEELLRHRVPVVVVEHEESNLARLREKGIPYLTGDATEEENLIAAGVLRARGLVAVVNKDTDNVFIVLTARDLNHDLLINARAGTPGAQKRMTKAGADRVVSPFVIGATHIAHNILRPTVTDFLELAMSGEGMELSMEELSIPEGSVLAGKNLVGSEIRSRYNLIVVAIKHSDGRMIYNPSPAQVLEVGDTLVAIGPQSNLSRFSAEILGCPHSVLTTCKH